MADLYIPNAIAQVYKFGMYTRINDIWVSSEKNIWIATDNGVYSVSSSGYILKTVDTSYGLPDVYVKKIVGDNHDRLYMITGAGLSVVYLDKHVSQTYGSYEGVPSGAYQTVDVSDDYIAVGSSEQLWLLNKHNGKTCKSSVGAYINDVQIIGDKIYVATYAGLHIYDSGCHYKKTVINDKVNDIYRYGDSLYIATKHGVYKIYLPNMSLSRASGIEYYGEVEHVVVSPRGDVVASIGNDIYIKPSGGKSYKLSIGASGNVITSIVSYGYDNVLVSLAGNKSAGLYMVENMFYVKQVLEINVPVRNNVVSYIKPENSSVVWFKYGESLYWFNKPNSIYRFQFMSSDGKYIDGSIVLSIAPWITGDKLALGTVLGFYVGNKVSRVMSQIDVSSFISESIVDVDTDGRGKYFILTRKYVYVYNAYTGYFKRLLLPKGEYAYDEYYYDGGIYISTTKSILKYEDDVIVAYHAMNYGATRIVGTLGGIWAISNGKLVFLDRKLQKVIPISVFSGTDVVDVDRWQNYLVVGTDEGVFLYKGGKIWGVFSAFEGMVTSNFVTDVAVWNNYLIVGTHSGLSVVDLGSGLIPFRDVIYLDYIEWMHRLTALGIVKGAGNGAYMPYKPVTVEELVILLSRASHIPIRSCKVRNAHSWAVPYICGYFNGKVPSGIDWKGVLTSDVLNKYFSYVNIPSKHGKYIRIDVFRFLYKLIYSNGLWR